MGVSDCYISAFESVRLDQVVGNTDRLNQILGRHYNHYVLYRSILTR